MNIRSSASLLLVIGAAGLALSSDAQTPGQGDQSKDPKAIICMARFKDFGTRNYRPSVYIDEVELARSQNGRYLMAKIDPGKHTFRAEDPQFGVQLDVKAGACYFFRVEIAAGGWKAHGRLTSVTPEQGAADLKRVEPIDASHVKDKDRVVDAKEAAALAATCAAKLADSAPPPAAP